ncbi:response regulator [Brevundimonas sp. LjRoot202]|uniref:response regulator n=1 Tax=Brevundimonas sp. LjRoot202 TaxID=3342281 RepID=UPI003ECC93C8
MKLIPDPLVDAAVLIVDDDDDLLRALARRFHFAGCRVTVAKDGEVALTKFDQSTPAVVVTDILMPNREGLETIMKMRERSPAVKILAISGGGLLGAASVLDLARRLGADAVLAKPFRADQVLEAVRKLLDGSDGGLNRPMETSSQDRS